MATQLYGRSGLGSSIGGGGRNRASLDPLLDKIAEIVNSLKRSATDDITGSVYPSVSPEKVTQILKESGAPGTENVTSADVSQVMDSLEEGTGIGLDDYEAPDLEIDLQDLASEEEEPAYESEPIGGAGEDSLFKSEEELAQMAPAERMQYRKNRLRLSGRGSQVRDTATGKTTEELRVAATEPLQLPTLEEQIVDVREPALDAGAVVGGRGEGAVVPEAGGFRSLSRDRVYEIIKEMNPQFSEQELNSVVEKAIAADRANSQDQPESFNSFSSPEAEKSAVSSLTTPTAPIKTQQPPTPSKNEMASRYENTAGSASNPYTSNSYSFDQTAKAAMPVASAAQEEEEQGGGFMSQLAGLGGSIGGFVKDNPDLMLQGLQTVGELGGAYKRGRREEEATKRMAEEARMGTAISALTRGRVNPSVAPQMPRTSAGEGMFDVMAGIGRGGQEFMAGDRQRTEMERQRTMEDEDREQLGEDRTRALEMYREERDWAKEDRDIAKKGREGAAELSEYEREQAEEQTKYERGQTKKDRKEALEERLAASGLSEKEKEEERERWEREQGRKDREVAVTERGMTVQEREVKVKEAKQAADSVPKIETVNTADARVIAEGINVMIDIFDKGWPSETGTWAPERTYGESARIQAEFDGIKTALIGRMKKFQELDRLSDMDYQIILRSLPDRGKSSGWNDGKRRGIFRALEIASEGRWKAPPIPSFWEGVFGGADDEAPKGEEVKELTPEIDALVDKAFDDDLNIVDEDAYAELERLGIIKP